MRGQNRDARVLLQGSIRLDNNCDTQIRAAPIGSLEIANY